MESALSNKYTLHAVTGVPNADEFRYLCRDVFDRKRGDGSNAPPNARKGFFAGDEGRKRQLFSFLLFLRSEDSIPRVASYIGAHAEFSLRTFRSIVVEVALVCCQILYDRMRCIFCF